MFTCCKSNAANQKYELIDRLLKAKELSSLTFEDMAEKLNVDSVYMAQVFTNQVINTLVYDKLPRNVATKISYSFNFIYILYFFII